MRKPSTLFLGFLAGIIIIIIKLLLAFFGIGALLVLALVAFVIWLVLRRR